MSPAILNKVKRHLERYIALAVILVLGILFLAKFAGPEILKTYVEIGMGGAYKQPVFSITAEEKIDNFPLDSTYLEELAPYKYPDMEVLLPKNFSVTKETKTKIYYKRIRVKDKNSAIYLLCKKPEFFIALFPRVKKAGVTSNYEFITKTLNSKTQDIKNTADAFFSIMKSIFTPDMGNQENLKIINFILSDKKGFITYNLTPEVNYFDCNFTDSRDYYLKIYIKDKPASLDLNKVLAIISTAKSKAGEEIAR
jgi:hypothetical protein